MGYAVLGLLVCIIIALFWAVYNIKTDRKKLSDIYFEENAATKEIEELIKEEQSE